MLNIMIDDKYKIESDEANIILKRKSEETDKRKEENIGEDRYIIEGYYRDVADALNAYRQCKIRQSDANSAKELLDCLALADEKINALLKPLRKHKIRLCAEEQCKEA